MLKKILLIEMHSKKGLVATVPILLLIPINVHRNKYMKVHPDHGKSILNVHIFLMKNISLIETENTCSFVS